MEREQEAEKCGGEQKESDRRQTESTAEAHKINGIGSTMELLILCWKL